MQDTTNIPWGGFCIRISWGRRPREIPVQSRPSRASLVYSMCMVSYFYTMDANLLTSSASGIYRLYPTPYIKEAIINYLFQWKCNICSIRLRSPRWRDEMFLWFLSYWYWQMILRISVGHVEHPPTINQLNINTGEIRCYCRMNSILFHLYFEYSKSATSWYFNWQIATMDATTIWFWTRFIVNINVKIHNFRITIWGYVTELLLWPPPHIANHIQSCWVGDAIWW